MVKDLNYKRISELTAVQEMYFKEKYGVALYNQHIEHDCLVEIVTTEDIVPFIGTFSDRMLEGITRDRKKELRG